MRPEVGKNSRTAVAPRRIANQPRCSIAVEHPASVDLAKNAGFDYLHETTEMGFIAMVLGSIADHPTVPGEVAQPHDLPLIVGKKWFFNKHVLAVS